MQLWVPAVEWPLVSLSRLPNANVMFLCKTTLLKRDINKKIQTSAVESCNLLIMSIIVSRNL